MRFLRALLANRWFQWSASLAVLVILLLAFREQLPFLGQAFRELGETSPVPLLLAAFTALLSLLAMAEVMRLLLRAGGVRVPLRETNAITLASNAWSTSLPGGPAFSAVLTFQVQRRWGASLLLCGWFFIMSSAISTMWLVLIGGAAILFLGAEVSVWSLGGSFLLMVAAGAGMYWLMKHPDTLERWVRVLLPRLNRVLRRKPQAGVTGAVEQIRQLNTVHFSRGSFALVSTHSLANRLGDAATLWIAVWAVTGHLPWLSAGENQTTVMGVALAYLTAKLAGSAQVTPGGVGTVEAALIATLVATGMTAVDATAAAIIYRAVSFLFVTLIGWVVYLLHYAREGFSGPRQLRREAQGEPDARCGRPEGLDSVTRPTQLSED
ncbi:MAG TPA: YbhN family protein [Corynebacterium sp.]|nr:YbhN family protein [Corynebacterium sp.]